MSRHIGRFGLIALAAISVVAVGGGGVPAGADPLADAQAQAATLQSQIEASNIRIDALGQQLDGAQLRLQQAQQAAIDAEARTAAAQAALDALHARVRVRAASDYRGAVSGQTLHGLAYRSAEQLLIGEKYAATQAKLDAGLLRQLNAAKQKLAADQAAAEHAKDQANADEQQIASARDSLASATAAQQQQLGQVQGQLVLLVAQQQQQRAAAALAAAQSHFGGSDGGGGPQDFPDVPAPSGAAAQAIAYARAHIGDPYVYAAAGPNAFDCSGLVMAAYASAGIQLPHYSGAQWQATRHIPFSQMLAGDILFWGDQASEHSAIYLGSGRIIEAGGTGNDVHIGPIWGTPWAAGRPY